MFERRIHRISTKKEKKTNDKKKKDEKEEQTYVYVCIHIFFLLFLSYRRVKVEKKKNQSGVISEGNQAQPSRCIIENEDWNRHNFIHRRKRSALVTRVCVFLHE